MSLELDDARTALVQACHRLAQAGLSPGSSGNVSMRVGDELVVTPTGSSLHRVDEAGLAVATLAGGVTAGATPTKELPVHLAVYRARPDARAVVHLHSPFATALSCLPPDESGLAPLPALTPYRVMRLGDVAVAPYAAPGSQHLGDGVGAVAVSHPVVLLANHGSVVAATSLDGAVDLAEELETAAQLTFLLRGLPHLELSEEQQRALRDR